MKFLAIFLSFLLYLNAALIDKKFLEENSTFLDTLLSSLQNSQNPQAKLQSTLILKIKNIKKEITPLTLKTDLKKIKDDKKFTDEFFRLIEKKVQSEKFKKELNDIEENLDFIKNSISSLDQNASNLLTLELQYAYFYKKKREIFKIVSKFEKEYPLALKNILKKIKEIEFNFEKYKKTLTLLKKKRENISKTIRRLSLEKERYKLLENETYEKILKKKIKSYFEKFDLIEKSIIKIDLILFFEDLKKKKERLIENIQLISQESLKLHKDPNLYKDSLKEALNEAVKLYLGDTKAYIFQIKESILSFMEEKTFLNIPLYKFAGGLGIFLLFLIFRKLFSLIVIKTLQKIVKNTKTDLDDKALKVVSGPLKFAFIIAGFYLGADYMGILNDFIQKLIKSLIIFTLFWLFYDMVIALEGPIYRFAKKFGKDMYREIGAFFVKTLKIFVFSVGLVAILQEWSINVSAFIASLGLGGLAFALAAKDTASNLFGGLTILADNALKIDDWIKVGSVEGTVEEIGLRTTKIRTFEKSLVTVPNQIIANNPIENFSRRGIRRIKMRVGLTYSTSRETMQKILNDIKSMLKSHPGIAQDATMLVNFDEMQDSSLSIFIYTFTNTAVWSEYMKIREDVNLKIMQIVEKYEDADFAFPSQSIYVEKIPDSKEV